MITFREELFGQVAALSTRNGVSFSAQVNILVAQALETAGRTDRTAAPAGRRRASRAEEPR